MYSHLPVPFYLNQVKSFLLREDVKTSVKSNGTKQPPSYVDYMFRPHKLEHMCLYEFLESQESTTRKTIHPDRKHLLDGEAEDLAFLDGHPVPHTYTVPAGHLQFVQVFASKLPNRDCLDFEEDLLSTVERKKLKEDRYNYAVQALILTVPFRSIDDLIVHEENLLQDPLGVYVVEDDVWWKSFEHKEDLVTPRGIQYLHHCQQEYMHILEGESDDEIVDNDTMTATSKDKFEADIPGDDVCLNYSDEDDVAGDECEEDGLKALADESEHENKDLDQKANTKLVIQGGYQLPTLSEKVVSQFAQVYEQLKKIDNPDFDGAAQALLNSKDNTKFTLVVPGSIPKPIYDDTQPKGTLSRQKTRVDRVDEKELDVRKPVVSFPDVHSASSAQIDLLLTDIMCALPGSESVGRRPSIDSVCKELNLDIDQTHFLYVTATYVFRRLIAQFERHHRERVNELSELLLKFHQHETLFMYFGGVGGSGKSRAIKALIYFLEQWGINDRVVVTGMTNLAACLLGGQSTHSALVLNIKGPLVVDDRHRHAWSRIVLVLIDETSMMSIQTLGDGANQLKLLGDSRKLLGGIGVVLCGDFSQLPCTGGNPFCSDLSLMSVMSKKPVGLNAQVGLQLWHKELNCCIFASTNHRAFKDPTWAVILEQLHDHPTRDLLEKLNVMMQSTKIHPNSTFLAYDNIQRVAFTKEWERQILKLIATRDPRPMSWRDHGRGIIGTGGILAIEGDVEIRKEKKQSGSGKPANSKMRRALGTLAEKKTDNHVLSLVLFVGMKYIFTHKTSRPEHGAPKNMPAYVLDINIDDKHVVWNEHRKVHVTNAKYVKHVLMISALSPAADVQIFPEFGLPPGVIVVQPNSSTMVLKNNGKNTPITLTQLPLVSAKVITIHKSQGQTFDDGITLVNIEGRAPAEALYVAASRSTTIVRASSAVNFSTDPNRWKSSIGQIADMLRLKVRGLETKLYLLELMKCPSNVVENVATQLDATRGEYERVSREVAVKLGIMITSNEVKKAKRMHKQQETTSSAPKSTSTSKPFSHKSKVTCPSTPAFTPLETTKIWRFNLHDVYLAQVSAGLKTAELRIHGFKAMQGAKKGDVIVFNDKIRVRIMSDILEKTTLQEAVLTFGDFKQFIPSASSIDEAVDAYLKIPQYKDVAKKRNKSFIVFLIALIKDTTSSSAVSNASQASPVITLPPIKSVHSSPRPGLFRPTEVEPLASCHIHTVVQCLCAPVFTIAYTPGAPAHPLTLLTYYLMNKQRDEVKNFLGSGTHPELELVKSLKSSVIKYYLEIGQPSEVAYFKLNQEQDVRDTLELILTAFSHELLRKRFYFVTRSTITCCGISTDGPTTSVLHLYAELSSTNGSTDVKQVVEKNILMFTNPTETDKPNKSCSVCHGGGDKPQQIVNTLCGIPPDELIVIQKLFDFGEGVLNAKTTSHITFSEAAVDLSSLWGVMSPINYKLRAVILHKGVNFTNGHYVAWIRECDNWYEYDDGKTQFVSAETRTDKLTPRAPTIEVNSSGKEVVKQTLWHQPYMLFYEKLEEKVSSEQQSAAPNEEKRPEQGMYLIVMKTFIRLCLQVIWNGLRVGLQSGP